MSESVPVLFKDSQLLAIDKPAGLLVHPSREAPDRRTCLRLAREAAGQHVFPIHRLDRGTSGVLLFALTREAASRLSASFREKTVEKRYLAVVRGWTPEAALIEKPLRATPEKDYAAACSEYRRLAVAEVPRPVGRYATARYSLLEVRTRSGRLHQIRKHLVHVSHPIIGDTIYGDGRHNRFMREHLELRRLLLACVEVRFPHPESGASTVVRAPLAPELTAAFERLGWTDAALGR